MKRPSWVAQLILFQESPLLPAFFFQAAWVFSIFSVSWAGFNLLALPESDCLYCLQLGRKDGRMEGGREGEKIGANEQGQFQEFPETVLDCLLSAQRASLQNGMF